MGNMPSMCIRYGGHARAEHDTREIGLRSMLLVYNGSTAIRTDSMGSTPTTQTGITWIAPTATGSMGTSFQLLQQSVCGVRLAHGGQLCGTAELLVGGGRPPINLKEAQQTTSNCSTCTQDCPRDQSHRFGHFSKNSSYNLKH